jgi:hypothetical protein
MAEAQRSLIFIDGYIRWFILVLAAVGATRSLISLLTREARFMRLDVGLSAAYGGLLILHSINSLFLISTLSVATTAAWAYLILTLAATIVGNLHWRFRARPDRVRHQIQLGLFVGSLILIIMGLLLLEQAVLA